MSTPHKKPKPKNNAKPKNASKKSAAKNNAKQPPARKTSKANHTAKSKTKSKKPTAAAKKPKAVPVYVVVREIGGESPAYTEPDIVFASKPAAIQHAEKLNREMRSFANPFEFCNPQYAVEGGETAFLKFLKKNKYPLPPSNPQFGHYEWARWWDQNYFAMSDQQRETLWDQLTDFHWHKVRATKIE